MSDQYCVLAIKTGMVLYAGSSEYKAAVSLEPGSVYGVGITPEAAGRQAQERRNDQTKTTEAVT